MSESVEWLAGVNALFGVWLIAIPFVFADVAGMGTGFAFWNYLLVGGGIVVLSGYNWWTAGDDERGSTWAPIGTGLLGLWLVVVPFLTDVAAEGWLLWNDVIVGLLVAGFAAYNAYEASDREDGRVERVTRG